MDPSLILGLVLAFGALIAMINLEGADPQRTEAVVESVKQAVSSVREGGEPVLVCAPSLRPAVRRLVSAQTDGLPVLSYTEATAAALTIETVGVVRDIPAPAVGVVPAALGSTNAGFDEADR